MKFRTQCKIPDYPFSMDYSDGCFFIGSCFADNIGRYMVDVGFNATSNPFGVLYNPVSIVNALQLFCGDQDIQESDIFESQNGYRHWFLHSRFRANDKNTLLHDIQRLREHTSDCYNASRFLVITLGSAYAWRKISDQQVVANCHKMPANLFSRGLLCVEDMVSSLQTICAEYLSTNTTRKIVLTVSPVRYLRDGLINSNRSKARLIEVCHRLTEHFDSVYYFPAFELVNDELRDYRFFKEDMVHPTDMATRYVWEKFREALFAETALEFFHLATKIAKMKQHSIQDPKNEQSKRFFKLLKEKENELLDRFPM